MIKKIIFFTFLILILSPIVSLAEEISFLEFAPDISKTLNISSVDSIYQPFIPHNDFLSGFDIWIDNDGSSGVASFSLRSSNGSLIASKNATISHIDPVWGGKKFHVVFNEPVAIQSSQIYKIKIQSSMPNLRIYYSSRLQLLEHSENYSLLKNAILPSEIGTATQEQSFKIALYESGDNMPPIISNVSVTIESINSVRLNFNSNEPVDYMVNYYSSEKNDNRSIPFTNYYGFCNEGLPACSILMPVISDASYSYTLTVKDNWNNQIILNNSFESLDNSEEIISNVAPTSTQPLINPIPIVSNARIIAINSSSVKIAWTTNIAANGRLVISTDQSATKIISNLIDNTFELEHLIYSGLVLTPKTDYFATVISANSDNASSRQIINFTTLDIISDQNNSQNNQNNSQSSTDNNQNSNQTRSDDSGITTLNFPRFEISTSENGQTILTLKWDKPSTGDPDGYRIDIFDSDKKLVSQTFVDSGNYEKVIKNLGPGKYQVVIYAKYGNIFEKIVEAIDINIPNPPRQVKILRYGIYSLYLIIILAISGFVIKRFKILSKIFRNKSGVTLIEIIVATTILIGVMLSTFLFGSDILKFGNLFEKSFNAENEVQQTFALLAPEIRSMGPSNLGSYPIESAATSSLSFYSDMNGDGLFEKYRYFLSGTMLKKGIITPIGIPLTYNPTNEIVKDVVHNVIATSTPIFSYYDSAYSGLGNPMVYPIDISLIRLIKTDLTIKDPSQNAALDFSVEFLPRNLRSN